MRWLVGTQFIPSPQVAKALILNPEYAKIAPGCNMLKTWIDHMESMQSAMPGHIFEAAEVKKVKDIVALGNETVTMTFAVYKLATTIPAMHIPAARRRAAAELQAEVKTKMLKQRHDVANLEVMLGKSLHERLVALMQGEAFDPMSAAAASGPQAAA